MVEGFDFNSKIDSLVDGILEILVFVCKKFKLNSGKVIENFRKKFGNRSANYKKINVASRRFFVAIEYQ